MRTNSLYLLLLLVVLGYAGCHDNDNNDGETANFLLDIKAIHDNDPLVLGQTYQNAQDYQFNITLFRFYLSHLILTKTDGTEVEVKDVDYLNFEAHHSASVDTGEQVSGTIPPGDYTSLRFAIGVDSTLNFGDPAIYPSTHPLSIYKGAHWDWNTGYIFLKLEGHIDTIPHGNGSLNRGFQYHLGTMPLYREIQFDNDFTVPANGSYEYKVKVDVDRFFYSDSDTLDAVNDHFSHTTEDTVLARRVMNLIVGAFSKR